MNSAATLKYALAAFAAVTACASPEPRAADAAPPRQFVQAFYDWYVPAAAKRGAERGARRVAGAHAKDVSPDLVRQLREDDDAQEKADGVIVGLDFDPFVGGQDSCERYEVGAVRREGPGYTADVHGVCSGERQAEPDAVAVIEPRTAGWQIANVRYPGVRGDLLEALRLAREERAHPAR